MPLHETVIDLPRPAPEIFAFLAQPANLLKVSPPDLNFSVLEGPERLALGARVVVQVKRMGIAQRIVSVVTAFEQDVMFTDEQKEGPFRKWVHTHRLEPLPTGGTRMTDRIEFEAPGGLLGLVLTAHRIGKELTTVFAYRTEKFREMFG